MATAGSSRSNFTLSGTEDIGGGMRAIFLLNHRLRPNTGEFNNPGDTLGSTHTGDINVTIHATNAIYCRSPSMGGLQLHAAVAAAEGQIAGEQGGTAAKPLNKERPLGLGIVYAAGPLRVAVAFDKSSADQKTTGL